MKVVVVGCTHAGTSAVKTILSENPDAQVTVYERNDNVSFLSCGIALYVGGVVKDPAGLFYSNPEELAEFGADVKMEHDVLNIDSEAKTVTVKDQFADCTPVVLYDPVKKVQASVHSGWRGTTKQISLKAIERMVEQFECDKETILAYVGPSINLANYEVGPEVYEAFKEFKSRDDFFEPRGEKYLMSMLDANLSILLEAGLKAENIEIERASTYTDNRLHSARKEGPEYKLNGIVTMMSS